MLISAWPVAFGIVEATAASLMLISPDKAAHRIHLVAATILLVAVAAAWVVFPWW